MSHSVLYTPGAFVDKYLSIKPLLINLVPAAASYRTAVDWCIPIIFGMPQLANKEAIVTDRSQVKGFCSIRQTSTSKIKSYILGSWCDFALQKENIPHPRRCSRVETTSKRFKGY